LYNCFTLAVFFSSFTCCKYLLVSEEVIFCRT
jgi:hypothetical protein